MVVVYQAPVVWNLLKGVICVYKPAGVTAHQVRRAIIHNLSAGLCDLECRPPIKHVFIEGDPAKSLSVKVAPSFSDDPLVVGPRYQQKDFRLSWANYLGKDTSGVFVLGINQGTALARKLHESRPTRAYHIKGRLGEATDTFFIDGKVVEKARFQHVRRSNLDRILAAMQASHQRLMFQESGVDPQSQAAYDLALKGPIRPSKGSTPLIYSIKCTHFSPPDFTVEVQCINEYEAYLRTLVHNVGIQLHTVATCTSVRCIRHGHLTLDHALLRKHWHLQQVVDNMATCRKVLNDQPGATHQTSANLVPDQALLKAS